jgi:glycosyltransferase involved in cell wall biosynthesis
MRIALVVYGSIEQVSGGYFYDRKLAERLRFRGDAVDILSLPWRGYGRALLGNFGPARFSYSGYDLIIQDELAHPSLFFENIRYRRGRKLTGGPPLVCLVHHLRSSEARSRFLLPLYRLVERIFLSTADAFIYNSRATELAVRLLAPHSLPGLVAPPAGNFPKPRPAFAALSFPGAVPPLSILFVGNLIERKGLHVLLAALDAVGSGGEFGGWRLTVVGNRDCDRRYTRRIDTAARRFPPGRVVFEGAVSDERLEELYRSSQVLAVPSSHEGFGIVYLEAMSFGVVPIASSSGGAGELVEHGANGFLVDKGDSASLAELLRRLMADRDLLARLRLAAVSRAAAFPGWDETMDRVRSFLRGAVLPPRP